MHCWWCPVGQQAAAPVCRSPVVHVPKTPPNQDSWLLLPRVAPTHPLGHPVTRLNSSPVVPRCAQEAVALGTNQMVLSP
jgi:hypothetical protein